MVIGSLILACSMSTIAIPPCDAADCARIRANLAVVKTIDDIRAVDADIDSWPDETLRQAARYELGDAVAVWVRHGDDASIAALIDTRDPTLATAATGNLYSESCLGPATVAALIALMRDRDADADLRWDASFAALEHTHGNPSVRAAAIAISSDDEDPSSARLAWLVQSQLLPYEVNVHAWAGSGPLRSECILSLAQNGDRTAQEVACALAMDASLPAELRGRALQVVAYDCLVSMLDEAHWFDGIPAWCAGDEHSVTVIAAQLGGMRTARAYDLLESLQATLLPRLDEGTRNSVAHQIDQARIVRRYLPWAMRQ